MHIYSYTKSKPFSKNEDAFGYNQSNIVIVDGATDKSGNRYRGKTSGEIVSQLIVKEALNTNLNGYKLVDLLNKKIYELYRELKIIRRIKVKKNRFTCSFIVVRLYSTKVLLTSLGDLGFRINGEFTYTNKNILDSLNAQIRSDYIRSTRDIKGSRKFIEPFLIKSLKYQNNASSSQGCGVLDGLYTPSKFVKIFKLNRKELSTLELFTDGYSDVPSKTTLRSWELMQKKINKKDPNKHIHYKSTKSFDDRTIIIAKL
jgi:hypothetical protein